jgi:hypothetical protein
MKRRLQIVGIVGAVIVAAVIALPFGINVDSFRPKLETELSAAIGRPVRSGQPESLVFREDGVGTGSGDRR